MKKRREETISLDVEDAGRAMYFYDNLEQAVLRRGGTRRDVRKINKMVNKIADLIIQEKRMGK